MEKEIYYWSPFIGRVATVRSVINSMIGLKDIELSILRLVDKLLYEWNSFKPSLKKKKVSVIDIQKNKF